MSFNSDYLTFYGISGFRNRFVLSILSGKSIRIEKIRFDDPHPGIKDYEIDFLRLLLKITNGSKLIIDEDGTSLTFHPGFIEGGVYEHNCSNDVPLCYYFEAIYPVAIFAPNKIEIKVSGVTEGEGYLTMDIFREVTTKISSYFGMEKTSIDVKVTKRGMLPNGGGIVKFLCNPIRKSLRPVQLTELGLIDRIRGWSFQCNCNVNNTMIDTVRVKLNLLPDVWIFSESENKCNSPGYGISLVARSKNGLYLSSSCIGGPNKISSEVATQAALSLLQEISNGGCFDSSHQTFVLLLMVLCTEDVSSIRLGKLTKNSIRFIRLIRKFFPVVFHISENEDNSNIISVKGVGYANISRELA